MRRLVTFFFFQNPSNQVLDVALNIERIVMLLAPVASHSIVQCTVYIVHYCFKSKLQQSETKHTHMISYLFVW